MFYVYLWLREDGTPYYVGKGRGNRAFIQYGHRVHKPEISRILVQDYASEQEAFEAEKFFIAFYGRIDIRTGCLANLAEGGLGGSAAANGRYKRTDLHRQQLRNRMAGNKSAAGKPNAAGRMRTMSSQQRSAQARKAAQTRWGG